MSTPSIALIPSGYKATKLYSQLPTNGDGDLDFARTSIANRVNGQGLTEKMGVNVPRLDYSDGGCPSLLLEPQSTNLITYSEEFSQGWSPNSVIITDNNAISPSGFLDASLIDIASGVSDQRISTAINMSGIYSYSVFAKKGTANWLSLRIGSTANIWFDLENGVIGNSTITTTYIDSTIEDYGNGWYRCTLIYSATGTGVTVRLYPCNADLSVTQSSGNIYIYGAQVEEQPYATSYIYNNGNSAGETRPADTASKSGLSNYINSQEGVLFLEAKLFQDIPTNNISVSLSEGTNNEAMVLRFSTIGEVIFYHNGFNNDSIVSFFNQADLNLLESNKFAIRFGATENECSLFVNGVKGSNNSSFVFSTVTKVFNDLKLSLYNDTFKFNGKIKDLRVYNTALTDQELTELTTI